MRFQRLSEGVRVEDHSTVEDWWPRNSYRQVYYVFTARSTSAFHWNWTTVGDDQRPKEAGTL